MQRYPAIIRKERSSDYGVEFPDVPGCFSAGSSLEEARRMGAEALRLHLDGLVEEGDPLPRASSLDTVERRIQKSKGADFYAVVEIEAEPPTPKVQRVNITVDERLLGEIDREAEARGMTRSGFLSEAARILMRRKRA